MYAYAVTDSVRLSPTSAGLLTREKTGSTDGRRSSSGRANRLPRRNWWSWYQPSIRQRSISRAAAMMSASHTGPLMGVRSWPRNQLMSARQAAPLTAIRMDPRPAEPDAPPRSSAATGARSQVVWPVGAVTGNWAAAMKTPASPAITPLTPNAASAFSESPRTAASARSGAPPTGRKVGRLSSKYAPNIAARSRSNAVGAPRNVADPRLSNKASVTCSSRVAEMCSARCVPTAPIATVNSRDGTLVQPTIRPLRQPAIAPTTTPAPTAWRAPAPDAMMAAQAATPATGPHDKSKCPFKSANNAPNVTMPIRPNCRSRTRMSAAEGLSLGNSASRTRERTTHSTSPTGIPVIGASRALSTPLASRLGSGA